MIYKNLKDTTGVYIAGKAISAVYSGVRLIWELAKSCFSRGYWVNDLPWKNEEPWKNNEK